MPKPANGVTFFNFAYLTYFTWLQQVSQVSEEKSETKPQMISRCSYSIVLSQNDHYDLPVTTHHSPLILPPFIFPFLLPLVIQFSTPTATLWPCSVCVLVSVEGPPVEHIPPSPILSSAPLFNAKHSVTLRVNWPYFPYFQFDWLIVLALYISVHLQVHKWTPFPFLSLSLLFISSQLTGFRCIWPRVGKYYNCLMARKIDFQVIKFATLNNTCINAQVSLTLFLSLSLSLSLSLCLSLCL